MSQHMYNHDPLTTDRSTRVFHLHSSPSPDARLKGHFTQVTIDAIDAIPSYSALSYCWEDQKPCHSLDCGDGGLIITPTVRDALLQLRRSDQDLLLWVDSICINQVDLEEKSSQVAMIGDVFQNARNVLVWLGKWDDAMVQAVQQAKALTTPFQNMVTEFAAAGRRLSIEEGQRMQRELHANVAAVNAEFGFDGIVRNAFDPILDKKWFRRIWTVQEIVLPIGLGIHRGICPVTLFGGDPTNDTYSIDWTCILILVDALKATGHNIRGAALPLEMHSYLTIALQASRHHEIQEILNQKPGNIFRTFNFSQMLLFGRQKQSWDPRDKAFAIHGIMEALGILGPAPDYRKSVTDVFRDLTISCIQHDKDLAVLFEVPSDLRSERPDLPSWVPDWSDPGWRCNDRHDENMSRLPGGNGQFCASGPRKAFWTISTSQLRLTVRAKVVDIIDTCSEGFLHPRNPGIDYSTRREDTPDVYSVEQVCGLGTNFIQVWAQTYLQLRTWIDIATNMENYPTGEAPMTVIRRTLVQDLPELAVSDDIFADWVQRLSEAQWEKRQGGSVLDVAKGIGTIIKSTYQPGAAYHAHAVMMSSCRTFFTTVGDLMGTAPARKTRQGLLEDLVRPGDHVAIIAGLELPMILRAVEDEENAHRLVSFAYVDGLMYGEAWEDEHIPLSEIDLL